MDKEESKQNATGNSNNCSNDDKVSVVSIICRICFDDNKDEQIITPCLCKVRNICMFLLIFVLYCVKPKKKTIEKVIIFF